MHKAIVAFAAHGVTIGATERQGCYQDFIDHHNQRPHAALKGPSPVSPVTN